MSMQLDLNESDYELSFFNGAWAREMNRSRIPIRAGKYVMSRSQEHHQTELILFYDRKKFNDRRLW